MTKPYHVQVCRDWEHFISEVSPLAQAPSQGKGADQWVFRGQKDHTRELETTLERACKRFSAALEQMRGCPEDLKGKRRTIEKRMLREFRRRGHQYMDNVPGENQTDEWLALMRHYGAPTRLLDVTYSPYVAAYFAFENAESDRQVAIWAINTDWCKRQLRRRSPFLDFAYRRYQQHRDPDSFRELFMADPPRKLVLSVAPFRLSDRQAFQRGAFLCPGDVEAGFMKNLCGLTEGYDLQELKYNVKQFIVHTGKEGKLRDHALRELDLMNINRVTLFPGFEGFAQSFEARIPSVFTRVR